MRTEKEIKKKIIQIRQNKANAKYVGSDVSYVINTRLEKMLKWVLEEKENEK